MDNITISKREIEMIIDFWRASNRYNAIYPYKTDERIRDELHLIIKLFDYLDNGKGGK